jgi:hypothetical protein
VGTVLYDGVARRVFPLEDQLEETEDKVEMCISMLFVILLRLQSISIRKNGKLNQENKVRSVACTGVMLVIFT